MAFRLALNTVTIKPATLDEKVAATAEAGYEGIGLWNHEVSEFVARGGTLEALAKRLKTLGLVAPEMCSAGGGWQYADEATRRKALEDVKPRFEMCAALSVGCIIAAAAEGVGELSQAADDFAALCRVAAQFGVRVAFEIIGPRKQLNNMAVGWEVVRRAAQPNGGIMVDTFHFYRGGSTLEQLQPIPTDKIYVVHINDATGKPREQLTDADRVHVGRGVIPVKDILAALKAKGFDGFLSLELFNRDYWAESPRKVAADGKAALTAMVHG
ncbi:MAG: sugar phosphate isomerase/epimerase [Planctomycetes bacterium]|nr:sugar phosphate isomerase/epimerase [Planctomycetota bacterium]MBM4080514.1 sugar phosphate isomerase/epimerase [Planctomycetota bacterium]